MDVQVYNKIKTAVSSGYIDLMELLSDDLKCDDLHAHFCKELPKRPAVCHRCEMLLKEPVQKSDTLLLRDLLEHGAYPPDDMYIR